MKMEDNKTKQVIFTDTYKTKEVIWEAYYGYITHNKDYKMSDLIIDPIVILGLNKYAHFVYDEIVDFFEKFEKELGKEEIAKVEAIIKRNKFTSEDYTTLRRFYAKFMLKTGIRNILKDKEVHNHSVRYSR